MLVANGEKLLNSGRQLLLPELLVVVEHVGLSADSADFSSLAVADINTFIVVQRNGFAGKVKFSTFVY